MGGDRIAVVHIRQQAGLTQKASFAALQDGGFAVRV
jgi:hypothetical protein